MEAVATHPASHEYTNFIVTGLHTKSIVDVPQSTQIIRRIPCGGKLVGMVSFEAFDNGVAVEVLVPWQKALEYLRRTQRKIVRVFWMNSRPHGNYDVGRDGWSWGSWHRDTDGHYTITVGGAYGSAVLEEVTVLDGDSTNLAKTPY